MRDEALEGPPLSPTPAPASLDRRIESRAEFQAAVRQLMAEAARAKTRQMWWVSANFEDWPLDQPQLLEILVGWVRSHAAPRLTWLAHDFEVVRRRMPRMVRWRQTWAHLLDCRAPVEMQAGDFPTLLLVEDVALLQMVDTTHWRGRISTSRPELGRARDQFDALLQRSEPAFPVTTLGI